VKRVLYDMYVAQNLVSEVAALPIEETVIEAGRILPAELMGRAKPESRSTPPVKLA
jgi:hypothetical protein